MWKGAFIGRFSMAARNVMEPGALMSSPCCLQANVPSAASEPDIEADQSECHDEPRQVNRCECENDSARAHPTAAPRREPCVRRAHDRRERAAQREHAQR